MEENGRRTELPVLGLGEPLYTIGHEFTGGYRSFTQNGTPPEHRQQQTEDLNQQAE